MTDKTKTLKYSKITKYFLKYTLKPCEEGQLLVTATSISIKGTQRLAVDERMVAYKH